MARSVTQTEGARTARETEERQQTNLRKKKGKREDKNTWRGVTLLSVGSKVLAAGPEP